MSACMVIGSDTSDLILMYRVTQKTSLHIRLREVALALGRVRATQGILILVKLNLGRNLCGNLHCTFASINSICHKFLYFKSYLTSEAVLRLLDNCGLRSTMACPLCIRSAKASTNVPYGLNDHQLSPHFCGRSKNWGVEVSFGCYSARQPLKPCVNAGAASPLLLLASYGAPRGRLRPRPVAEE